MEKEKPITIRLTRKDHSVLCAMLGYAAGAQLKDEGFIHPLHKEVTDWVLIQGAPNNYTYYHEKEALRAKKEAEFLADEKVLVQKDSGVTL